MKKLFGRHLILELWGCQNIQLMDSLSDLEDLVKNVVENIKTKLISIESHRFEPHGLSVIGILEESHISVHTWPVDKYVAIDVFVCDEKSEPVNAIEIFAINFECKHKRVIYLDRGISY